MTTLSDRSVSTAWVRRGHHVAMSAVKTSKARSTWALTVTDFSTTCSLVSCIIGLSFLGGFLEGRERVLPEALEVLAQVGARVSVDAVEVARPLATLADEAGMLEDAEVLRNGWAGDGQARGDLTDGARALAKALANGPPCGVRPCCHSISVSHCLR